MRKFIFFTGGVLSGLGKGVAAASIGMLLSKNYKIVPIKCDGYLNVDPGTMNPIEHGEVFVLDDGGEVDMDFGHYERLLGITCKSEWSITMGKVFAKIMEKERKGDYLGKTVQMIPHVTDLIKDWWKGIGEKEEADIVIIEIGGTVGDIENQLFIEAARQLHYDLGDDNVMFIHLTYIPILKTVKEPKTKPTQQSVRMLMEMGIIPDIIIARCEKPLNEKIKEKISKFCMVPKNAVISGHDLPHIEKIALNFYEQGVLELINKKLHLNASLKDEQLEEYRNLVKKLENGSRKVTIGICGKYTLLHDSYASILEAIKHAAAHLDALADIKWIETTALDEVDYSEIGTYLKDVDAVIVPGGFGKRGVEGKIKIIRYCREHNIPFLGICFGLQLAVVEFARNVCKLEGAHSTEIDPKTPHPVIDLLPEQLGVDKLGGTMRKGAYKAIIKPNTKVFSLYGSREVYERHRHRYEVNPSYHKILEEHGLIISGISPDGKLAEFIEVPNHKFFVATQAHPEFKSSLFKPAPLFYGLIKAALNVE